MAGEFPALVAGVGDDRAQVGKGEVPPADEAMTRDRVGDASRLDPAGERQAERVDEDVALPALHLLVRVEAARAAALGGY